MIETVAASNSSSATNSVVIRSATLSDAVEVHRLISENLEMGHLLPRSLHEVNLHVPRFLVAAGPDGVVGCGELSRLSPTVAEIRSLVVSEPHRGVGVGKRLLGELIMVARRQDFPMLCAFTHQPRPFVRLGFTIVPHPWVPEKISTDCHTCQWFRHCQQYAVVLNL